MPTVHLLTVQNSKGVGSAVHRLRDQLGQTSADRRVTTHYPDRQGHALLNVALGRRGARRDLPVGGPAASTPGCSGRADHYACCVGARRTA